MTAKKKPIVKPENTKPKKLASVQRKPETRVEQPKQSAFPIVGIGASAGGLLQRGTPMQVFQVKDRMRAEANCVHVIPPNKDLSSLNGVLHLLDPYGARGLEPADRLIHPIGE